MPNPFVRRLQALVRLPDADQYRLSEALGPARFIGARTDIIGEGDDPRAVDVILEGWACRYRQLADGRRQIVSLLLPGDPCDAHMVLFDRMDHAIGSLTPVAVAQIPGQALLDLVARSPNLDDALRRETMAAASIQREWTVSLGCRSGVERLAHLFCEVHARLAAVGLADGTSCPLPMTQIDLAEAMGQTSVHINRTLQELRGAGLITLRGRQLTVLDPDGLTRLAQFDPAYLHLRADHGRSRSAGCG